MRPEKIVIRSHLEVLSYEIYPLPSHHRYENPIEKATYSSKTKMKLTVKLAVWCLDKA